MRAISSFIREFGIDAVSCSARLAFRMRVSMSAMGSVSMSSSLPARLRHAWNRALMRKLAQTDATQPDLPIHRTRATVAVAARVRTHLVLRLALLFDDERLLGHAL